MAPSHLLLLVASCGAILSLAHVIGATTFMFNSTSEVIRDDDSGRIRGIQSRENKSFVLGGLFPIHFPSGDSSSASPCGPVWPQALEWVEAMLYAIDRINADPDLLPGVELGYDIRDTCLSETLGLDEAIDLIITGSNLNIASCQAELDAAKPSPNESGLGVYPVPTSGIVGAAGSRVSVPVASLGRLFNMPQVSYASTSPLLSDQTRYSYFRRTIPADDLQVQAMVDLLHRFGWNYTYPSCILRTHTAPRESTNLSGCRRLTEFALTSAEASSHHCRIASIILLWKIWVTREQRLSYFSQSKTP